MAIIIVPPLQNEYDLMKAPQSREGAVRGRALGGQACSQRRRLDPRRELVLHRHARGAGMYLMRLAFEAAPVFGAVASGWVKLEGAAGSSGSVASSSSSSGHTTCLAGPQAVGYTVVGASSRRYGRYGRPKR